MANEKDINNAPIELSDEELDGVSGGVDIFLSGSMFEQRDIFSVQRSNSRRRGGSNSIFKSSSISSSAFQLIGLGFGSASDALSFLQGFAKLFGRR
ncbi:MAG: CTB family bacteriocin [Aulosira sp. DedQUE10]|nr:CTB family bacteriocin [Aulosira sp. DedQUE10]